MTCSFCKVGTTFKKCSKCGNTWHEGCRKPQRKGVSGNVCEGCGAVDKHTLIR